MDAIERENVGEREGTSILENLRKFPEIPVLHLVEKECVIFFIG